MLDLKIGKKSIKQYISACLVYWRNNKVNNSKGVSSDNNVKVYARGKLISKAVDVAEILKRFNMPKLDVDSVIIGTEELVNKRMNGVGIREIPITNNVSTIEIFLKEVK